MADFTIDETVDITVFYFDDKGCRLLVHDDLYMIAYGYRVCAPDAFQPEITFDFAFNVVSFVSLYQIPTSCIFYYQSFQCDYWLIGDG